MILPSLYKCGVRGVHDVSGENEEELLWGEDLKNFGLGIEMRRYCCSLYAILHQMSSWKCQVSGKHAEIRLILEFWGNAVKRRKCYVTKSTLNAPNNFVRTNRHLLSSSLLLHDRSFPGGA